MKKSEEVSVGLSAKQLAMFKRGLEKDRRDTQKELDKASKKFGKLLKSYRSNPNIESADGTCPPYEEGVLVGGLSVKLRNIDMALARIKAGSYGICADIDCGETISLKRLRARKTAKLCDECQDTLERKNKCCHK